MHFNTCPTPTLLRPPPGASCAAVSAAPPARAVGGDDRHRRVRVHPTVGPGPGAEEGRGVHHPGDVRRQLVAGTG